MSGAGKVVGTGPKPAISEVVAGLACLAASAVFFTLARGLPHTVMSSVVLPAPLEPMRVTISPRRTCRLTPLTAQMEP